VNTLFSATLLSVASLVGTAQAADLVADAAPVSMMADRSGPGLYVQGLVGLSLTNELEFASPGPTLSLDLGPAVGGTVGLNTGFGGLALEVDAMASLHRQNDSASYGTQTLMVNAKYSFMLTDTFEVYAGAGIGAYGIIEDYDSGTGTTWGTGYQVMVGGTYDLTDQLALVGEYRYQNSFEPIDIDGPATVANSALLAGLKFTF
jgi:OmpA-OmpF porin, OOP family